MPRGGPWSHRTKGFTARAIRILEEGGKLSVDDPLARFLPDFPSAARITLHQLLTHRSGVGSLETDLARWGAAIAAEVAGRSDPSELPGWWVEQPEGEPGHRVLSASGRLAGFAAGIQVLPAQDLVLVSLSNIRTGAARWIDRALLATALEEPIQAPTFAPYVELPPATLAPALGRYQEDEDLAVELFELDGAPWVRLFLGGGRRELAIHARSDKLFVDREYFTTYRLVRDPETSAVTALVFADDRGNETSLPRVTDP